MDTIEECLLPARVRAQDTQGTSAELLWYPFLFYLLSRTNSDKTRMKVADESNADSKLDIYHQMLHVHCFLSREMWVDW